MSEFKPCALVPTYDNPRTVEQVVRGVGAFVEPVLLVDDGSGPEGRAACEAVARAGLAQLIVREKNGGKGAAVKTGLAHAKGLGFTHVVQVDADGQHDLGRIPSLLAAAARDPAALVLGHPEYDETAPRVRLVARRFTQFWIELETKPGLIQDAMVGFRVYPVEATLAAGAQGDRMDFDVEITVRMAWAGVPIVNVPVKVRYLTKSEGGVSHFQPFWDNLRFSWLHTRLCTTLFFRWLGRRMWKPRASRSETG